MWIKSTEVSKNSPQWTYVTSEPAFCLMRVLKERNENESKKLNQLKYVFLDKKKAWRPCIANIFSYPFSNIIFEERLDLPGVQSCCVVLLYFERWKFLSCLFLFWMRWSNKFWFWHIWDFQYFLPLHNRDLAQVPFWDIFSEKLSGLFTP